MADNNNTKKKSHSKEPNKKRQTILARTQTWERLPKSKEDWLKVMVEMIKHKTELKFMNDKDIGGTIKRARGVLFVNKQVKIDPDMPDCYYWSEERVASWIQTLGFNDVKKMFELNNISGRRLITVDAVALNQMGMTDLTRMRQVTKQIRDMLKVPVPNALRAVMRLVPFELYLKRKALTGRETDHLTFEKFCQLEGFSYELLRKNKCAYASPLLPVQIDSIQHRQSRQRRAIRDTDLGSSDEETITELDSIKYCPTVEFVVRNLNPRDQLTKEVLDKIIETVVEEVMKRETQHLIDLASKMKQDEYWANPMEFRVRELFDKAYSSLGIDKPELSQERVEFVASVAEKLVNDILKTRTILEDIDSFQAYMENSMDPNTMKNSQMIAAMLLEDVGPISALLTLGQLELEALIKEAPGLKSFVNEIVTTAEKEVKEKIQGISPKSPRSPSPTSPTRKVLSKTRHHLAKKISKDA